jgi:Ca2+-transporting ATPase
MFNARSVRPDRSAFAGVLESRNFWMVLGLIVVVQILLTQFGGAAFNTAPLPLHVWINIILVGASALLLGELFRFVRRQLRPVRWTGRAGKVVGAGSRAAA